MQFPDFFFEDEVRDGFYVPALMKRAWAAQLEVLEDIARVCEKHHILWYLGYGTLLGAVRHGGFIPWDDDIDIMMLREDYTRFKEIAETELTGYCIAKNTNDEYQHHMYTFIHNGNAIRWDRDHMEKYHGFPFRAGIDIYPLDYLAADPKDEEVREELAGFIRCIAQSINDENQDTEEMQNLVHEVEELLHVHIDKNVSQKDPLYSLVESVYSLYDKEHALEVADMAFLYHNPACRYSLSDFQPCVFLPFEYTELPGPSGYDRVLQTYYGNYMERSYCGDAHGYLFYDKFEQTLADAIGEDKLLFKYHFSADDLKCKYSYKSTRVEGSSKKSKEVVFFCWKASYWHTLAPYWEAALADPDCDVQVIPIPWFYRNWDGSFKEMQLEESFPGEVVITDYRTYDFKKRQPDVIIIQNPFDEYNPTTSVHPDFYSSHLKQYTNKLIYIPCFTLDEIAPDNHKALYNMKYFAAMPGIVHSDTVIVQSETMRQTYIHILTDFAGENTKHVWEEKIICNFPIHTLKTR